MKATRKKKDKGRSRQRTKNHSHCTSVDLVSASGKHAKPFFVLKGKVKPRLGDHRVTEDTGFKYYNPKKYSRWKPTSEESYEFTACKEFLQESSDYEWREKVE